MAMWNDVQVATSSKWQLVAGSSQLEWHAVRGCPFGNPEIIRSILVKPLRPLAPAENNITRVVCLFFCNISRLISSLPLHPANIVTRDM